MTTACSPEVEAHVAGRTTHVLLMRFTWCAVALSVGYQLVAAWRLPWNFDEAFNAQVPLNLVDGRGYATDGALSGGTLLFDPFMSSGPTLLLPAAGFFAAAGQDPHALRLAPMAAYVLLVAAAAIVGRRITGSRLGAALTALSVPALSLAAATRDTSNLRGPGDLVGEPLSAALLLISCLLLRRGPSAAGAVFGLAVLTKTVTALFGPAMLIAVCLAARRSGQGAVKSLNLWAAAALGPILVYQVVRLVVLGPGEAQATNRAWVHFLLAHGSGVSEFREDDFRSPIERMGSLHTFLPVGTWALLAVTAVVVVVTVARSRAASAVLRPRIDAERALVMGALGGAATMLGWWLLVSSRDWVRHVSPAVLVAAPVLVALLFAGLPLAGRVRTATLATLTVAIILGSATSAWQATRDPGPTLVEQQRVADFVASSSSVYAFYSYRQVPEIRLLARDTRAQLPGLTDDQQVVVLPEATTWSPSKDAAAWALCESVLLRTEHYTVCALNEASAAAARAVTSAE